MVSVRARNKVRSGCGGIEFSNVQGENNNVSTYSFDGGGSKPGTATTNVNLERRRLDGRTSEEGQSSRGEEEHYVGNRSISLRVSLGLGLGTRKWNSKVEESMKALGGS